MERTYFFQTRANAVHARRKRGIKHWSKGGNALSTRRKKRRMNRAIVSEEAAETLLGQWIRSLESGGANNSTTLAGLKLITDRLSKEKPFTSRSVFVDFGSGAGIPCIYVAKRFGCKAVGLEKDSNLVELARGYAEEAGVSDLCEFIHCSFDTLDQDWVLRHRATHIFVFDGVFRAESWNVLFHEILLRAPPTSVGASVVRFSNNWPSSFVKLGGSTDSVRLSGSSSSFRFGVWRVNENR